MARIKVFSHKRRRVPFIKTSVIGERATASPVRNGKRPNKARSLTEEEEEEELWKARTFGAETLEAVTCPMWWLLTQFFSLRGRQEHYGMKMGDF